jgi:ABC-type nitrate/sulfonate/bicarbonate transport system substrate-binding protein
MRRLLPSVARRLLAGASVLAILGLVAAATPAAAGARTGTTDAAHDISPSRCSANRAAGRITFVTGFEYDATVGTIDPVAAAAQGYFADLCLHVSIKPGSGNPTPTAQAVAAGTATIGEVGGASDVITTSAGGIRTDAIAMYGNVNAITLITLRSITNLKQLEGKTLGYKGSMPPEITAMLTRAGVDLHKVREVGVGYDPTILPRGQVQALTGYKSNEVPTLEADGYKIRSWAPDSYGIKGTFNALVANPSFARRHPTAVEDFLRASFEAYGYCQSHAATCLADEAKVEGAGYDLASNRREWQIERALVDHSLLPGRGLGAETVAQFRPELQLLVAFRVIRHSVDLSRIVTPGFVAAIERHGKLIWPAP